jgi:hypothetical protein
MPLLTYEYLPQKASTTVVLEKRTVELKKKIISIVWDIMSCSPLTVNLRTGETCSLHLQSRRIKQQTTWRREQVELPEDAGAIFLQNVGGLSTDYMALCPER